MQRFDAQISLPVGANPPDPWFDAYQEDFPIDLVVSRDADGGAVSRAGDLVWDRTAYHPRGKASKLYFDYWSESKVKREIFSDTVPAERLMRVRELQLAMCLYQYRNDSGVATHFYLNSMLLALKYVARFSEEKSISVFDVLASTRILSSCIESMPDYACVLMRSWLHFFDQNEPSLTLPVRIARRDAVRGLNERASRYVQKSKQTAPLPTGVYSQLILNLEEEVDFVERHQERLFAALREALAFPGTRDGQRRSKSLSGAGVDLIEKYELEELVSRWAPEGGRKGIFWILGRIQMVCKLQIHVFSGMRAEEAQHLPYECMVVKKNTGKKVHLLEGVTTKMNAGHPVRVQWVTTESEGFRAVRLAQLVAKFVYEFMGVDPNSDSRHRDSYPLFVSTGYLPWVGGVTKRRSDGGFKPGRNLLVSWMSESLLVRICPRITERDVAELEDIDPFRDWRSEEKFQVGSLWPLAPHQLRRSLALYSQASGCVALSSVRRQLQHISNDLSGYYSSGSEFAKNFLANDPAGFNKHIAREWQQAGFEAEVLMFVFDVVNTDEPLHGGAGVFYDNQKQRGRPLTKEQVEVGVRNGSLAYRPTPLGGCTKPGRCDKKMGFSMVNVSCATDNCKHLVGRHSKIVHMISAKKGFLASIDNETLTYRAELEELRELESVEKQWRN